jgi:hypothetical protein
MIQKEISYNSMSKKYLKDIYELCFVLDLI